MAEFPGTTQATVWAGRGITARVPRSTVVRNPLLRVESRRLRDMGLVGAPRLADPDTPDPDEQAMRYVRTESEVMEKPFPFFPIT